MAKFTFQTNTHELKGWLGKRKSSLLATRVPMEPLWQEIREHYEPNLGKALIEGSPDNRRAEREDDKILNTEPRNLLHRLGAGLQSGITNQARQWFRFSVLDKRLGEHPAIRKWLADVTEIVQNAMNRSNIYPSLDQIYMHLGAFGTSAGLLYPDEQNSLHVYVVDEGAYWIAEDRRGRVNMLMRRSEPTIAQLVEDFGEGWLPDQIKALVDQGKLEERFTVWNLVCPHDPKRIQDVRADRLFVSVYWIEGQSDPNNGIIAIRSFNYNPILAPRWAVLSSSPYGVGCGEIGLGDNKQLQRLELDKLRIVAQEVDPAMLAAASMKGQPIRTHPGGVTYAPDQAMGAPGRGGAAIQRLFETGKQLQPLLLAIEATERRLGKTFFTDLFSMMLTLSMDPKQKTAREVNELSGEKVAMLGPILTRLNTDLLDPLCDAAFYVCYETGLLPPPPPELEGAQLKTEYVSSLHVEQQSTTRLSGLYRVLEFAGSIAQFKPDIWDKVDADEAVDIAGTALVEPGIIREDKVVTQIRQARADQEMRAAQAEQSSRLMPAAARAAKDMSQIKPGTGSALDAIAGVPS